MNDFSRLSCLCLAAGQSSRMGPDHKLLKTLGPSNKAVLEYVLEDLTTIPFAEIVVVTGARADEMQAILNAFPVRVITNMDYRRGLHSSLCAGVRALADTEGFLVCLGDQPFSLRERVLAFATKRWDRTSLVRSVVKGVPGHPVLIGAQYKSEILETPDADSGASYLFRKYKVENLEQSEKALWDLDTPEDFERYSSLMDTHQ